MNPFFSYTQMNDNRAATLIVDNNNIPWIAWLGEEKKYTEKERIKLLLFSLDSNFPITILLSVFDLTQNFIVCL